MREIHKMPNVERATDAILMKKELRPIQKILRTSNLSQFKHSLSDVKRNKQKGIFDQLPLWTGQSDLYEPEKPEIELGNQSFLNMSQSGTEQNASLKDLKGEIQA